MTVKNADALLNLSLYYNDLEMYDESLGCLDKCLEIVPDDGAVLLQMANVYKNMEDYPKALLCIESALGKNPDDLMLKLSKYLK